MADNAKLQRRVRNTKSAESTVGDRPSNPYTGQPFRNPDNGFLEIFNGEEWKLQEDEEGLNAHIADVANPHATTPALIGLGNVNNTSDIDKPISTLQQAGLDTKPTLTAGEVDKSTIPVLDLLRLNEAASAPSTVAGTSQVYSDGTDIKVLFGDGTTKTFTLV